MKTILNHVRLYWKRKAAARQMAAFEKAFVRRLVHRAQIELRISRRLE